MEELRKYSCLCDKSRETQKDEVRKDNVWAKIDDIRKSVKHRHLILGSIAKQIQQKKDGIRENRWEKFRASFKSKNISKTIQIFAIL